jgi:hypothetical protein
MASRLETAGFLADDPGCLVEASLACPCCLSARVEWRLELDPDDGYDSSVECACRGCGHERTLFVTPEQAFRLSLHAERPPDLAPRMPGLLLAI